MKKPFKVMTTAALTAVIGASAVIPAQVDAAENESTVNYGGLVFEQDGASLVISQQTYEDALIDAVLGVENSVTDLIFNEDGSFNTFTYIEVGGAYYSRENYEDALIENSEESMETILQYLVDNYTPLPEEETSDFEDFEGDEESELEQAIDEAESYIQAIASPSELTLNMEDVEPVVTARNAVEQAEELGADLSDIVNIQKLRDAEAQIETLREELNEREQAMYDAAVAALGLPDQEDVTLDDEIIEEVEDVRGLVDEAVELGAEEDNIINIYRLHEAEEKIAELEAELAKEEAVEKAEAKIHEIGPPSELTLDMEDVAPVVAARTAVDAIELDESETLEELVINYGQLVEAEEVIASLRDEMNETETVMYDIAVAATKLPDKENVTLEDREDVQEVRDMVDEEAAPLGIEEGDIYNIWRLHEAEERIAELEASQEKQTAIDEAVSLIQDLPNPSELMLEDSEDVEQARTAVNTAVDLGASETSDDIMNIAKLELAEEKIAELESNLEAAQAAVFDLPADADDITLDDKAQVEETRSLIEQAGAAAEDITSYFRLENAEKKIAELEAEDKQAKAVEEADSLIAGLPAPSSITLDDEAEVEAARLAVNTALDLGASENDIADIEKLEIAEAKMDDFNEKEDQKDQAVQEAQDAINALPADAEADITLEDKDEVEAARDLVVAAINLGASEDDFSIWRLEDAEDRIAELEGLDEADQAVNVAENKIEGLGNPEEITLDDQAEVEAARDAVNKALDYESVSESDISNIEELEAAEDKIEELSDLTVDSVDSMDDISVDYGTTASEAEEELPDTISAQLSNGDDATLEVTWTADEGYDPESSGDYTYSYELSKQAGEELPFTISDSVSEGEITVTVEDEPLPDNYRGTVEEQGEAGDAYIYYFVRISESSDLDMTEDYYLEVGDDTFDLTYNEEESRLEVRIAQVDDYDIEEIENGEIYIR